MFVGKWLWELCDKILITKKPVISKMTGFKIEEVWMNYSANSF
jgi:hypothetical protein